MSSRRTAAGHECASDGVDDSLRVHPELRREDRDALPVPALTPGPTCPKVARKLDTRQVHERHQSAFCGGAVWL